MQSAYRRWPIYLFRLEHLSFRSRRWRGIRRSRLSRGALLIALAVTARAPVQAQSLPALPEETAVGEMKASRIMNRQVQMPRITVDASRDTIIAGLEAMTVTLAREVPLGDALTVTARLTQEQDWLSDTSHDVTFAAGDADTVLVLAAASFSTRVVESGDLTVAVDSVDGYDTGEAIATVFVISEDGPAVTVSLTRSSYLFGERVGGAGVIVIARMAADMPRGASIVVAVSDEGKSESRPELTAVSGVDFWSFTVRASLRETDFALADGRWVARRRIPLSLIDDDVREGRESFRVHLHRASGFGSEDIGLLNPDATPCSGSDDCRYPAFIDDPEDIPVPDLSVSADEISEKGETSSTATVAITNGKTYATDQTVTFAFDGTATEGADYEVGPVDADDEASGHQVLLAAGSTSVGVTLTTVDDALEEGNETITLSVTHDGDEIGRGTIRIIDRLPGPGVEITFEGVEPPRDEYTAGVATGPFTARFTFSERVEGFRQEDIDWQTHYLTTIDTTTIALLVWDYTVIREGLEYTARMMPDQEGRVWIGVPSGSARSAATADGNQSSYNSLWVDLPPDRLMVAPAELTIDEGDEDGAHFLVVPTSAPTGDVTVTVTFTDM